MRHTNEREDQGEGEGNTTARALKNTQENKLVVAEMRMLRWMCGVTKLDKIRNERLRRNTKVGEIAKKVEERRLK